MSVQRDAWSAIKTQLTVNIALAAYVKRFKFNRQEEIFQESMFPLLIMYPVMVKAEEYLGIPKQKTAVLALDVYCKIHSLAGDDIESGMLEFDELTKNAIEGNLQLGGKAIISNIGDSVFTYLDKEYGESNFQVNITLPRFTAGSR